MLALEPFQFRNRNLIIASVQPDRFDAAHLDPLAHPFAADVHPSGHHGDANEPFAQGSLRVSGVLAVDGNGVMPWPPSMLSRSTRSGCLEAAS